MQQVLINFNDDFVMQERRRDGHGRRGGERRLHLQQVQLRHQLWLHLLQLLDHQPSNWLSMAACITT
jgi:hypothetical protein